MLSFFWHGESQLVYSVTQDDRCALARLKSGRAVAMLYMFDIAARPRRPMSIYVRRHEMQLMLAEVSEGTKLIWSFYHLSHEHDRFSFERARWLPGPMSVLCFCIKFACVRGIVLVSCEVVSNIHALTLLSTWSLTVG